MSGLIAPTGMPSGAYDRGDVLMPPKSYVYLAESDGDFRFMLAYLDAND